MGRVRIRAVGQFAWHHADLGAECLRCGLVQVYCDFEALACFQERGWAVDLASAARRFRCRCGSGEVRLTPIPIHKRPKPVPGRPAALRPIYREEGRALSRRGAVDLPDRALVEEALTVLRRAVEEHGKRDARDEALRAAMGRVRPLIYRQDFLDELWEALGDTRVGAFQSVRLNFGHVLRQLGRPSE